MMKFIILFVFIVFSAIQVNCFAINFMNNNNGGNVGSIVIDGQVMEGNVIINNSSTSSSSASVVGNNKIRSEKRTLAAFNRLIVKIPAEIKIIISPENSLTITGDDNIIALLSSDIKHQQLTLTARKAYSSKNKLSIEIKTTQLNVIEQLASGDIYFERIKQEKLAIILHGQGDIYARGHVRQLDVSVTGSGDVRLAQLKADNARINIDGMGNARVNVSNQLNVSITGMGDVLYSGNPQSIHKNISGMGSVEAQ